MHKKRNSLALTIAVFLAFLAFYFPSSSHKAMAQDALVNCNDPDMTGDDSGGAEAGDTPCSNVQDEAGNAYPNAQYPNYSGGPPPGAIGDLGAYNDGTGTIADGDFTNSYTNAVTNVVSKRQYAKHSLMSNIKTVDAKLQYCFDSLKAIFATLNLTSTGNVVQKIVAALLSGILMALVGIVCGLISAIKADFKTLLSAVNNLMCLPIPKLHLPRFKFPAFPGAGHCNGISLIKFTTTAPSTGKNQPKVLWHIWGKDQEQ